MHAIARGLTIGQLGRAIRMNPETVRYYERIGLTHAPDRTEGNRRIYDEQAVRQLVFVRRARELGFSIADIRTLSALASPGNRSCAEVKDVASAHLASVQAKLADLARLEAILTKTVSRCGSDTSPACPVLEMLDADIRFG
jgi:MerR family mercuric resistance operon transcriptional regulator